MTEPDRVLCKCGAPVFQGDMGICGTCSRELLLKLAAWEQNMGGWDSPLWDRVRTVAKQREIEKCLT